MRWGVRRKSTAPPHGDAAKAKKIVGRARKNKTTDVLSNAELRRAIERMNLEQQYSRLRPKSGGERARRWLAETLLGIGKDEATKYARDTATQVIKESLKAVK